MSTSKDQLKSGETRFIQNHVGQAVVGEPTHLPPIHPDTGSRLSHKRRILDQMDCVTPDRDSGQLRRSFDPSQEAIRKIIELSSSCQTQAEVEAELAHFAKLVGCLGCYYTLSGTSGCTMLQDAIDLATAFIKTISQDKIAEIVDTDDEVRKSIQLQRLEICLNLAHRYLSPSEGKLLLTCSGFGYDCQLASAEVTQKAPQLAAWINAQLLSTQADWQIDFIGLVVEKGQEAIEVSVTFPESDEENDIPDDQTLSITPDIDLSNQAESAEILTEVFSLLAESQQVPRSMVNVYDHPYKEFAQGVKMPERISVSLPDEEATSRIFDGGKQLVERVSQFVDLEKPDVSTTVDGGMVFISFPNEDRVSNLSFKRLVELVPALNRFLPRHQGGEPVLNQFQLGSGSGVRAVDTISISASEHYFSIKISTVDPASTGSSGQQDIQLKIQITNSGAKVETVAQIMDGEDVSAWILELISQLSDISAEDLNQ